MSFNALVEFDYSKNGKDVEEYFKNNKIIKGQQILFLSKGHTKFRNGLEVDCYDEDVGHILHFDDGGVNICFNCNILKVPYPLITAIGSEINLKYFTKTLETNLKLNEGSLSNPGYIMGTININDYNNLLSELNLLSNI